MSYMLGPLVGLSWIQDMSKEKLKAACSSLLSLRTQQGARQGVRLSHSQ